MLIATPLFFEKIRVASKNYTGNGSEEIDLVLACDDSVSPFLVELSVRKQSARLTSIDGWCVANNVGIGPGGTLKLKNGKQ